MSEAAGTTQLLELERKLDSDDAIQAKSGKSIKSSGFC